MTARVGIDLGTTYSLVAHVTGGAPRVLPSAVGQHLPPSARLRRGGRQRIDREAAQRTPRRTPRRTALSFKRGMGTSHRRYELGGKSFRAEELSALRPRQSYGATLRPRSVRPSPTRW